jgi:hypothetical protein
MPPRMWIGALLLLGLTWLPPSLREAALGRPGLHAVLAIVCGLGAVALRMLATGPTRRTGVALLVVLSWAVAVTWEYLGRDAPGFFKWPSAIAASLVLVGLPVLTAAIVANVESGATRRFAQVTSLAMAAAPVSTAAALVVNLLFTGEGP